MKKMTQKFVSFFLSITLLLTITSTAYAENTSYSERLELTNPLVLKGLEYNSDIPLIESEDQLDYEFVINDFVINNGNANLMGTVYHQGIKVFDIDSSGVVYADDSSFSQRVGRITVMFEPQEEYAIINLNVQEHADGDLLFPANAKYDNKAVMELAVSYNGVILYFEDGFEHPSFPDKIRTCAKEISKESESSVFVNQENTDEPSISEDIQASNAWQLFMNTPDDVTILDDEEATLYAVNSTPAGVPTGIPANVFTTAGAWASVNNPTYQTLGYYATTNARSGTNNFVTALIQWEYIYNPCSDFPTGQSVASSGVTSIRIHLVGEFTYIASRNTVEYTGDYAYMRLQEPTILMALMSNQQLLSNATTSFRSQGSNLEINWLEYIGLVKNEIFQTAATLLGAITYKEEDHTTACSDYQDTLAKQLATYGKVIRARKISHNGNKLAKKGDYLRIAFTVRQPRDLTRTPGRREIVNKYFFHVYGRDIWGVYNKKLYTVEQFRYSYYDVK